MKAVVEFESLKRRIMGLMGLKICDFRRLIFLFKLLHKNLHLRYMVEQHFSVAERVQKSLYMRKDINAISINFRGNP